MSVVVTKRFGSIAALIVPVVALTLAADPGSAASHRQHHTIPAANPRETDTSVTGTLPAKPQREPVVAARPDDEVLPPPFHLPSAPRSRVRDCGLKWQAMKSPGEVGEAIWRDFATRCLAAATGPFDKHSGP